MLEVTREQQRWAEQRLSVLEALVQHLLGSAPPPPVVAQTNGVNVAEATAAPERRLLPAEGRARSRVTPLIEYGAQGSYVLVCPREGTLSFAPDSPEWFDWLATHVYKYYLGTTDHLTLTVLEQAAATLQAYGDAL